MRVPEYYLPAMVNGDTSGMEEQDIKDYEEFEQSLIDDGLNPSSIFPVCGPDGELCDKVRLSFDGFLGFVNYKGKVESKWICDVVVYMGESPKVVAVRNGIEYLIGVIARCTSHDELLGSLEKLFNDVAVQNGGCLRGGA